MEPRQRASRRDAYGDSLPNGAVARLGTIRLRHGGEVTSVAFAPDGKTFLSGGGDNVLRLWEVAGGKLRRQFYGHSAPITAVAFAPDGAAIASASMDNTIRVWDAESGQELHRLANKEAMEPAVTLALAFGPDSKIVATAGADKTIHLWQLGDEDKELRSFTGHEAEIVTVAFVPGGKQLVSGSKDKTIRLWEVETGKQLRAWEKLPRAVRSLAVSADGTLIAAAIDSAAGADEKDKQAKQVLLWNVASGEEAGGLSARHFVASAVAFSPDGKTLAAVGDGLRLWDVASKRETLRFERAQIHFTSVAFAADGKSLALGASADTVWLMNASGAILVALDGHQGTVVVTAFSADGHALTSVSSAREVWTWDVAKAKPTSRLWRGVEPPSAKRAGEPVFALSPDGRWLAAHMGFAVRLWNQATGAKWDAWQLVGDAAGDIPARPQLAFSADSLLLAFAAGKQSVKVLDLAKQAERKSLELKEGITALALSPDGKVLAVGSGKLSPPGDAEMMEAAGQVALWDVESGKAIRELQGQQGPPVMLAFAPNGRWLASVGTSGAATIWDLTSGKVRKVLGGTDERIGILAFAPDGHCLATAGEGSGIHVWEVATWKARREFVGHRGPVRCLAFAPDGRTLASGSADTSVLLWDVSGLRTGLLEASKLSDREREDFWSDLSSDDSGRANLAVWALAADPERTVPFLARYLQPAPTIPKERMDKLIADLDDRQLAVREQAAAELMKLGEQAEAALRQTLANRPTLELQRRIEPLLKKMDAPVSAPELLRQLRAVEILEHIGSPDAKKVLDDLTQGGPGARLTQEAKGAGERLRKLSTDRLPR